MKGNKEQWMLLFLKKSFMFVLITTFNNYFIPNATAAQFILGLQGKSTLKQDLHYVIFK